MTLIMIGKLLITFLIIFTYIFFKFFKTLHNLNQYQKRANTYEQLKRYKKAIEIRLEGLKLTNLTDLQRADLLIGIGGSFYYLKEYEKAISFIDQAFETARNEDFPYDIQYEKIIKLYIICDKNQRAGQLLEELIARQSYDQRFKRLERLISFK